MVKPKGELEPSVSGWTPELGARLATVIRDIGGLKQSAEIAGVSGVTLASWRDGNNEARFSGLSKLAQASGRSLDWLAYGIEAPGPTGLSDRHAVGAVGGGKSLAERLKRSRETVDAAAIAADFDPPQVVWEAVRTLVFKYDISIDDAAQLIDAVKHMPPPAPGDE